MITSVPAGSGDATDAREAHETHATPEPPHAHHNAADTTGNDDLFFDAHLLPAECGQQQTICCGGVVIGGR